MLELTPDVQTAVARRIGRGRLVEVDSDTGQLTLTDVPQVAEARIFDLPITSEAVLNALTQSR